MSLLYTTIYKKEKGENPIYLVADVINNNLRIGYYD